MMKNLMQIKTINRRTMAGDREPRLKQETTAKLVSVCSVKDDNHIQIVTSRYEVVYVSFH
jgi:hypothetical protein